RARLLDGIEVGALQVFHQRQLESLLEPSAAPGVDNDRHLVQSGDLGGAEPALTGDQLVAGQPLANQERLKDAVHPNRVRQLLKRGRLEGAARLLWVRLDVGDRDLERIAPPRTAFGAQLLDVLTGWDQGFEAPPKSSPFVHLAISSFVSSW